MTRVSHHIKPHLLEDFEEPFREMRLLSVDCAGRPYERPRVGERWGGFRFWTDSHL